MRNITLSMTILLLLVGCKKNDCVSWVNPEFENIVIDTSNYINASDLAKKYNVIYSSSDCDDKRLMELFDLDGRNIKLCGCLRYNVLWGRNALYTKGEMHDIPLNGNLMDDLPHDSTLYYITGVVEVKRVPTNMAFKRDYEDTDRDNTLLIGIFPVSYSIKNSVQ